MIVEPDGYEFVEDVAPEAEIPPPPLDTIHEPAQTAAQIEADKLFEKGVAEVEAEFDRSADMAKIAAESR